MIRDRDVMYCNSPAISKHELNDFDQSLEPIVATLALTLTLANAEITYIIISKPVGDAADLIYVVTVYSGKGMQFSEADINDIIHLRKPLDMTQFVIARTIQDPAIIRLIKKHLAGVPDAFILFNNETCMNLIRDILAK
jgi:hypothetical protein